jgi:hypothetical protein
MAWDGNEFGLAPDGTSTSSEETWNCGNPVAIAHFGGIVDSPSHVRVNSTFLHDHSTFPTENVAHFAGAFKYEGAQGQTVFGSNISVADRSPGSPGTVVGLEVDVYGKPTTGPAAGFTVHAKSESSSFNGGVAIQTDSDPSCSWGYGVNIRGTIGYEAFSTWQMKNSVVAMHMGPGHLLAWDGKTAGTMRAWVKFNPDKVRFEFYIDGALVGHIP